jgi:hypothetical protein
MRNYWYKRVGNWLFAFHGDFVWRSAVPMFDTERSVWNGKRWWSVVWFGIEIGHAPS